MLEIYRVIYRDIPSQSPVLHQFLILLQPLEKLPKLVQFWYRLFRQFSSRIWGPSGLQTKPQTAIFRSVIIPTHLQQGLIYGGAIEGKAPPLAAFPPRPFPPSRRGNCSGGRECRQEQASSIGQCGRAGWVAEWHQGVWTRGRERCQGGHFGECGQGRQAMLLPSWLDGCEEIPASRLPAAACGEAVVVEEEEGVHAARRGSGQHLPSQGPSLAHSLFFSFAY